MSCLRAHQSTQCLDSQSENGVETENNTSSLLQVSYLYNPVLTFFICFQGFSVLNKIPDTVVDKAKSTLIGEIL